MSDPTVADAFGMADAMLARACDALAGLRRDYAAADLPEHTRRARQAALDAKIDYLLGLGLNPAAHPWVGDRLGREVPA